MANEYYNHGGAPSQGSNLSSSVIRSEFDSVVLGMNKLPGLIGNANKFVVVNVGANALTLATYTPAANGINADITQLTGLTTALSIAQGGTAATTTAGAAFALKGANADITQLTGLTTALSVAQGGTAATTTAGAAFALKGINADITQLTGLTTALSVAQGGTAATTVAGAAFALKGINADITQLTGLTTPLSVTQGGTAATTVAGAAFALKGANADITQLSGLTTALSIGQGGTGVASGPAALVSLGERTSQTGSFVTPTGPTAQRDATPSIGFLRYNTTLDAVESYGATGWGYAGAVFGTASAYKNKIMGGDFTVNPWQRGTSFAAAANGTYTADRWRWLQGGTAVVTVARVVDAPTIQQAGLFTQHALSVIPTTASATLAASDNLHFRQVIEGYNAAAFGFGQAGAGNVTLSFWVKATKIGTYCASIRNNPSATRSYVAEYTVLSSAVWEKKVITLPADVTGAWAYDNTAGMVLSFTLACGTTFQTPANTWTAGNFIATANQVNGADSITNDFRIALVQLEAGSTATQFDVRSFGQELSLCQRYYQTLSDFLVAGNNAAAGLVYNDCPFPIPMRAASTGTLVGTVSYGNSSGYLFNGIAFDKFRVQLTITAAGFGYAYGSKLTFSADL